MARPQRLNADYFSHDSDMRNDPKIKALRKNFGFLGYSVWCFLLEMLTDQDNFRLLWTDLNIELIAADFDCDYQQLKDVVDYLIRLDLMQKDVNFIVCKKQVDRLDPLIQKRKRRRTDVMDDHNAVNKELWTSETPKIVVSDVCNTQTKLNKTKLNEIKLNEIKDLNILADITSEKKETLKFKKPSHDEVLEYFLHQFNSVEVETCKKESIKFFDYYNANGWRVGKNPMKDWNAAARNWVRNLSTYSHKKDENESEKRRRIFNAITKK